METSEKRRGARILIVEREEPVARICLKALNHERFETQWVETPTEAWDMVESWRPQLYLLGDDFEDYLGLELCGQLRGRTNAPILMLTDTESVGYQINCLEAGADDVLIRPIAPPLLLTKCQTHMRRAYRYSIPPVPPKPKFAPQPQNVFDAGALAKAMAQPPGAIFTSAPEERLSSAPVTPEALPPSTNFHTWPRCEICHYIGPFDRFEGKDEHGRTIKACPACGETRLLRMPK